MNNYERKDKEDENSKFYDTATTVIGIAGAVGAVAGLLSWIGSGSGSEKKFLEEKMMKAPGKDGYIVRKDFETNLKDYFTDLRSKK
ncbi:hypothetical protein Bca52824_023052 [Brassica carinata]|uniref:Uncharacterized protein n=1 Tax=Brassica carinata TaxID=52824 RepID=A0A8X7VHG9_BRACI|nr:hypothetical protein Bca52824_023052 [Brassica carinata]